MIALLAGLLREAVAPLLDNAAAFGVRLVKKIALFLVAALCINAALIALTIAFALWIASLAGPVVAALAVALVYGVIAGTAVMIALAIKPPVQPANAAPSPGRAAQIDAAAAPFLDMLQRSGFERERIAILTSAFIAKRADPFQLVGGALLAGFLAGRFWKLLKGLLEQSAAVLPVLAVLLAEFTGETTET